MSVDTKSIYYGFMQAILHFGAVIGCILSTIFLNNFSRRNSLIYTGIIAIIGCSLSTIVNYGLFLFARFLCGVAVGLYSVLAPIYSKNYL